ncbi:MAG TPA: cell division protein ZapD [Nevskiaceae bacterium]|nr:cell division protein ZapD [Nevskiaceae bacterium]
MTNADVTEEKGPAPVVFEQPLNERVRTFLRLEFLFGQHAHHRRDPHEYGLRARLHALLDILTVLSRSDLKKELVKELQEQSNLLSRLASRPGVDVRRLEEVQGEIAQALQGLQQLTTQFAGAQLRESEFLISVHNRSTIPGGTCAFDVPTLHYWLSQPAEVAQRNLDAWFADLSAYERAVRLWLRLLRGSTEPVRAQARNGMFVHMPQGPCQLVRVFVDVAASAYPEISAGAHRFTVRFMSLRDVNQRATQLQSDLPFSLQCCTL